MLISNIRENGEPIGTLPDGEMMSYRDMMHAEVPHKATMLNAVEIRPGSNTQLPAISPPTTRCQTNCRTAGRPKGVSPLQLRIGAKGR